MSKGMANAGDVAKNVGVAVGVMYTEYYLNAAPLGMTAYSATSGTLSVVCGRVSFTLGLKGPSVSIDTACSSSLASLLTCLESRDLTKLTAIECE